MLIVAINSNCYLKVWTVYPISLAQSYHYNISFYVATISGEVKIVMYHLLTRPSAHSNNPRKCAYHVTFDLDLDLDLEHILDAR